MNGVAVDTNKKAFFFGRLAAHNPDEVSALVRVVQGDSEGEQISQTLNDVIEKRMAYLTGYQNKAYAKRYKDLVERVRETEGKVIANGTALTEAAARYYHKVLAYKDEYEVARLYTNGDFKKALKSQFAGNYKIAFNLAPPIMEKKTPPQAGRKNESSGRGCSRRSAFLQNSKACVARRLISLAITPTGKQSAP